MLFFDRLILASFNLQYCNGKTLFDFKHQIKNILMNTYAKANTKILKQMAMVSIFQQVVLSETCKDFY